MIKLEEIREVDGEDINEVLSLITPEEIAHIFHNREYSLNIFLREKHEKYAEISITAVCRDNPKKRANLVRYPTNIDSLYDSCIDVLKEAEK